MNKTQHTTPDSSTGQHTFHCSHVDLSILKRGDEHSDMNEPLHHKTPPIESKLHQRPANTSAAFNINTKSSVFGWLCSVSTMHEAITWRGLGARMESEWMNSYNDPPTSTLSTCSFINPAGRPFVCANIRLAVCLSVRSAVEVFPFFFFLSFICFKKTSASCDPIYRDFHLS